MHDTSDVTKSILEFYDKARKEHVTRNFKTIPLESLNVKQKKVVNLIEKHLTDGTQLLALVIGEGGTGKSFVIHALRNIFRAKKVPFRVMSFTGCASSNVDASTIHSLFNLGYFSPLEPQCDPKKFLHLAKVKFYLLDEVSMIGKRLLGFISERLKIIHRSYAPFGGASVIAFGDLSQLKPVADFCIYQPDTDLPIHSIAYMGEAAYNQFTNAIVLNEQMRVLGQDERFKALLRRIRVGILTKNDLILLKSREAKNLTTEEQSDFAKNAVVVFPDKNSVKNYNSFRLENNGKKIYKIPAKYSKMAPKGISSTLNLSLGTPVMLTHNICVKIGLFNGATGYVTEISDFDEEGIPRVVYVKFKKYFGKNFFLRNDIPILRTDIPEYCYITNVSWTKKQFPLEIFYASTIHKVQGLTLDKLVVGFGTSPSAKAMLKRDRPHIIYTALSRVRTLKDIAFTSKFDPDLVSQGVHCIKWMAEEERLKQLEIENETDKKNLFVNIFE